MAGAKPGVHVVQLKPIQLPDSLVKGNKFIKWDDDSSVGTPVTLRIDPNGYILYWRDQNKEMDCLDIGLIRDTRTGKYSRLPKEQKLRDAITMGAPDIPLEDKMVTICYGSDMVQLSWIHFATHSREVAKEWAEELFKCATNLLRLNSSPLTYLEKCYSKLSVVVAPDGRIPVRNIIKMFAQHKDDRKRVEKALESSHMPTGRNDFIQPNKFLFDDFFTFYRHLVARQEVDKVFHSLGAKKKPYLTAEQFRDFLNTEQRDPRLNEILYPYYDVKRAQAIIDQFERNHHMANKGHLSQEGFLRFLMSEENALVSPESYDLSEDMDQPLPHYFINSSHNTYLTGHQFTGKSSVEIYRQALLTGCRCVELDCWDGKTAEEEPIITHGYTMCTEILFKEVVEAIAESAFKVSDYPVILSFENHCCPKQQAKMAAHCRNILGEHMLGEPLDSHPLDAGVALPSPAQIKRKVIIKNKKRHEHKSKSRGATHVKSEDGKVGESITVEDDNVSGAETDTAAAKDTIPAEGGKEFVTDQSETLPANEESDSESETDEDSDEEDKKDKDEETWGTAGQEAEAGMEMSALVNYIQPVHFHSFEAADKRSRSYECSSFVETQATALLKEFPVEFVNYNKRQISRIYPKGTRVDSSNYMPQIFWNAGCQLVALNFQTLDLAMMLNLGIFEYNGRSGYILKPDFMRRADRTFDPFAESTVDGIVAGTVEIRIISGQLVSDRKVGTFVEVDMYGLPADTVRKKFRTKTIPGNGISPVYDEEPFVFKKVVLPNLATLRIAVYDENSRLLGHRVLPVEGLRPGYRHICMRNELNQPQNLSALFVYISVRDYVPDAFADFANALANPIAYQTNLEKHSQQLAVLEEDFDAPEEGEEQGIPQPELTAPKMTNPDVSCKRNPSVISKKSHTEGTPSLSRVGSVHDPVTSHDHSMAAVQGNVPPMNRMISTVSTMTTADVGPAAMVIANSRLNGPKSTSLPGSPLHSLSTAENGALKPLTTKIDVVSTTRLKDPDVLESMSIEELKEMKQYIKLVAKFDKELESLHKKHEKARLSLQELHDIQQEKLLTSHLKSKTTLEKTQRKSFKRASKHGNVDEVSCKNQEELTQLMSNQQHKLVELKKDQAVAMRELCRVQYQAELSLQQRHHPQLYDLLTSLMTSGQDGHMRKLEDIHNKEVAELKKKLDAHNREEMKSLAKKHKDKSELARIKREAQTKHITLAVQERQKLRDILERRKQEVEENHADFRSLLQEERSKELEKLQAEYEERLAQLDKELKTPDEPSSDPNATNGVSLPADGEQSEPNGSLADNHRESCEGETEPKNSELETSEDHKPVVQEPGSTSEQKLDEDHNEGNVDEEEPVSAPAI